jgi:hypothetical protein
MQKYNMIRKIFIFLIKKFYLITNNIQTFIFLKLIKTISV